LRLHRHQLPQAHARRVYPLLTSASGEKLRKDASAILKWIGRDRDNIEPAIDQKAVNTFSWHMVRRDLHRCLEEREEDLQKALPAREARGYVRDVTGERTR
jgi:hypothetical protein